MVIHAFAMETHSIALTFATSNGFSWELVCNWEPVILEQAAAYAWRCKAFAKSFELFRSELETVVFGGIEHRGAHLRSHKRSPERRRT